MTSAKGGRHRRHWNHNAVVNFPNLTSSIRPQNGTSYDGTAAVNIYSRVGDLVKIDYSDSTPDVVFASYNRQGLPRQITDVSGQHTLAYDELGRLLSDTLGTLVLSNHYDTVYGRDYLRLADDGTQVYRQDFAYSSADGRLAAVLSGSCSNVYGYKANSDLIESVTAWQGSTNVLTTTRGYEYGFRLTNIANVVNGTTVSAHAYTYDSLNRRTQARRADGSAFAYGYNDRSEVVSGQRRWADGSFVAGQQYQYAYDNIGNRTSAASGGDAGGLHLRSVQYTANALNQYESQTVPATLDVLGTATNAATVTVNNRAASRKADYFCGAVTVTNGSGPVYQPVVTLGVCQGAGTNGTDLLQGETNHVLVAQTPQTFSYDLDGNLTSDGLWSYTWDAENRLVLMTLTNVTGLPDAERKQLEFGYDFLGRRVSKAVKTWNGSAFANPVTTTFVYDGWNCIAILNSSFSILNSFHWGLDLSGTMDGAGGIGGLLVVLDHAGSTNAHFAGFDGNGNVTVLVLGDLSVSANYEYGPFGEPIRVSGCYAKTNPFRWSTKFTDEESGLVYYGMRLYSPSLGRWLNRDPLEEQGGIHLYAFVANNPVNALDPFGANTLPEEETVTGIAGQIEGGGASQAISFVNQVRQMADAYNDAQQFISDLSDFADAVEGGDSTDILIAGLQAASHAFAGGLPGGGGVRNAVGAAASTTVYQALGKNGETIYVGITKRFRARAQEHARGKGIDIVKIAGLEKLSPKDARAAEQALIELHGLKKNGGSLMNLINSISKSNPAYAEMLKRGQDLLKKAGYHGMD